MACVKGTVLNTVIAGPKPRKNHTPKKPTAIIAHTVKGKGISFMENVAGWHGVAPNDEDYKRAIDELGGK